MLETLRGQPALVVFLVIGIGYLLDRIRIFGLQVGATTGVLFAGLVLGHLGCHGSGGSQSIGFMLFIYCVGLRAGPQFFGAFRENGLRYAALTLVVVAVGVAETVAFGRWLALPPGYRAGLLAGALTSTPTLVAAQDAVRDGMATLPAGFAATTVLGNIAASYAISYVVGLFGLVLMVSLLPRLMGIDLKAEARRLAEEREQDTGQSPDRGDDMGSETDLVTFAFGIAAGILMGLVSVKVAGVPIGLGTAGGLMLSGLLVGYARTINPTFGHLPVAAAGVLMELGLQFFIANVGLEAGGSVMEALRTTGVWLPIAAFVVMTGPLVVGFVVGRSLLGFDPVMLFGALTGALTSTPALDIVNRQADSPLPTVGYAGTYAFANVLLAIAGSVLMRF